MGRDTGSDRRVTRKGAGKQTDGAAQTPAQERDERKWGRREVLRLLGGAAIAGAATGGGAGRGAAQSEPHLPTDEEIRGAEWLTGLEYTPDERDLLREDLGGTLEEFQALRSVPLDNDVTPSLRFDPLPPAGPDGALRADGRTDEADGAASAGTAVPGPPPIATGPGSDDDVAFAGVRQLAGWLAGGALSSVELTELYLARLSRWNLDLHCVIEETKEIALRVAKEADAARARGESVGPIHGIPWGAKDLISVEGTHTTWGAKPYETQIRNGTATVAQRLLAAGSPLLAKLSVGALAWGDVWFGGTTKNPWNLDQGSSGSSAGPAAATAAGLCGFSIGTETWGSIVSPSTRCGVSGLRPTYGRVSKSGVMALSWTMDKIGPICRRVEDCGWVLAAIAGPDGLDPNALAAPPFRWSLRKPGEIRVGYVPALFDEDRTEGVDDEAEKTAARDWAAHDQVTLEVLRKLGWNLVPVTLPGDLPIGPLSVILTAEATTAFDELTRSGRDEELTRQERYAWPNVFRQGQLIPAVEYIRASRIRTLLRQAMEAVFESVDVFVAPTFGGSHLLATNLTGHPSLTVPNGFRSGDGTPTSITFTGRLLGESDLLTVGAAYQEATGFHLERPPVGRSR
ncbi:MAG: amidase [Candidatus Eisenbacteria bacterium]